MTIVEGECDAMATYELLGSKWAVVSIKRGAASAVTDIKESIEYVESFDNVVICFDKDKAGEDAAKKVATILKPGKAKIVTLPNGYKDPNDMLNKGRHQEFTRAWWDAQVYTPSGIIRVADKQKEFLNREEKQSVPYPWDGLNKKLLGLRAGELEHWLIKQTNDNVGVIALEEDWKRTVDGILSIEANDKLFIDSIRNGYTENQLTNMFDRVFANDRVFIHAHFGANDIEEIFAKLRYTCRHGDGCW